MFLPRVLLENKAWWPVLHSCLETQAQQPPVFRVLLLLAQIALQAITGVPPSMRTIRRTARGMNPSLVVAAISFSLWLSPMGLGLDVLER